MKIGRRAFLAAGAVVAVLGGAAVYLAKPFQGRQLTATEKQACGLTVEAVEGPYHVSGMVELKDGDLNFTKLAGVPIEISGHVYDGLDAAKPLPGAAVEIWHMPTARATTIPMAMVPLQTINRRKLPCAALFRPMPKAGIASLPSIPASIRAAPAISISRFVAQANPN
jgi:hypothetical protein